MRVENYLIICVELLKLIVFAKEKKKNVILYAVIVFIKVFFHNLENHRSEFQCYLM